MKQNRITTNLALWAMIAFWAFPAYFGDTFAAQKAAKRKKPLITKNVVKVIELHNLEPLKEAFQRDTGKVRLFTILSPT